LELYAKGGARGPFGFRRLCASLACAASGLGGKVTGSPEGNASVRPDCFPRGSRCLDNDLNYHVKGFVPHRLKAAKAKTRGKKGGTASVTQLGLRVGTRTESGHGISHSNGSREPLGGEESRPHYIMKHFRLSYPRSGLGQKPLIPREQLVLRDALECTVARNGIRRLSWAFRHLQPTQRKLGVGQPVSPFSLSRHGVART
jgi:hypothetical protein